jgi:hypothetical protein
MINIFSISNVGKKKVLISILKILEQALKKTKNKKDQQKIRLCCRLLKKILSYDYTNIKQSKTLEDYLFELNTKKIDKKLDAELFGKILSQYILYAQD